MKNTNLIFCFATLTLIIFLNTNKSYCQNDTVYSENGLILEYGSTYEDKKNGEWRTFYESGEIESIQFFKYGNKHGKWIWYHENGIICAKEKYKNNYFKKGKFWDKEGNKSDISEVISEAIYPEGLDGFRKMVEENLQYPKNLQDIGIQGRSILQFIVNEEGEIEDLAVVKSFKPEFDKEAMRVVSLSEKWEPSKFHGQPVKAYFTFPIRFVLK
jgi:TonB family protein